MPKREVPGVHRYDAPAGGWGALWATARAVPSRCDVAEAPELLLRTNKPDGFDCPGCAWPDKKHTSTFEFCENGAKAVTWEATKKRVDAGVLRRPIPSPSLRPGATTSSRTHGRLTHPMAYDRGERHLSADRLGRRLRPHRRGAARPARSRHGGVLHLRPRLERGGVPLPAVRAANSAPTISPTARTCATRRPASGCRSRSASARARSRSRISTIATLIIAMGHNPGTNHPRMMGTLHAVRPARRADHRLQPAEGAGARALRRSSGPDRDGDA